jgi:uncharacterized protein
MDDLSPELMELDARLLALPESRGGMLLSELDGFLAGVLVCPELIPPSEWLPSIWGEDTEDAEPAFNQKSELEEFVGLLFKHYNTIAGDLNQGGDRYQPIYDIDDASDEILWETWIAGFEAAMALRPDSWAAIVDSDDDEAASAFSMLAALAMINDGATSEDLDGVKVDELTEEAPALIPLCVQTLNDWRQARDRITPPATSSKVGRNDPCPCGSGKKYKKCCGSV